MLTGRGWTHHQLGRMSRLHLAEPHGTFGNVSTGFCGKKSYGRSTKSCHITGITGQSSCGGDVMETSTLVLLALIALSCSSKTNMNPTIWSGIISGLLGGGLAVLGAWIAVRIGIRDLERTEIRRQRVLCITNLFGLRYALTAERTARAEDTASFMFEINRAGALFADFPEILNEIRDFYDSTKDKKPDAEARLIKVVKLMGERTLLRVKNLSDADVKKIFMLPGANTVVQFVPVAVANSSPTPPPSSPRAT